MSHLFRLMLALFLLHIALITTANLITRHQRPTFLDLFTNPDGTPCERPCLFGIRPGKMTIEVAKSMIRQHWLLSNVQSITTEAFGTIFMADVNGEFAGKRFRIWLLPDSRAPTMTSSVVFGVMEADQVMASNFVIPITSSGTLMTLFGQPAKRDMVTQPDNSREFDFPKQGLRIYVVPLHLLGKPTASDIFRPTPNDVILSFQVAEPFPDYWPRGVKWCGFTIRTCEPTK
jgi:hypothetical protein